MDYATKLVYQSNYWYNDGLKKANIRDLSGAIVSLRRSLQYNRSNIAARNLLGLVYYGRGDVAEALVEWILSKNFQSHDNIANYYIQKTRENTAELETINQAVKKYNQALSYAKQNGEDLAIIQLKKAVDAHPSFVKAYQLLALLYLHTEQFSRARQAIRAAHKLDKTDDITLRYMHELNQIRKSRTVKIKEKDKKDQQTVTYSIGNETIIQPVSAGYKENAGLHTMVNIAVGLLVGVAVMWFLILPAVTRSREQKTNRDIVAFSDQIAEQKAQISALQTELESFRSTSQETENAQATASATQESYEIVMNIQSHFYAGDMGNQSMAEELLKVNVDSLGTAGREAYDEMAEALFPQVCGSLYAPRRKAMTWQIMRPPSATWNRCFRWMKIITTAEPCCCWLYHTRAAAIRIRPTSITSGSSKITQIPMRRPAHRKSWMRRTAAEKQMTAGKRTLIRKKKKPIRKQTAETKNKILRMWKTGLSGGKCG